VRLAAKEADAAEADAIKAMLQHPVSGLLRTLFMASRYCSTWSKTWPPSRTPIFRLEIPFDPRSTQ